MAFGTARLALLALAIERQSKSPVIIAIGTKTDAPNADWLTAIIDPEDFKNYFDPAGSSAFAAVETLFDLPIATKINKWLEKGDDDVGISDGSGAVTAKRVNGKKFWIDGIARIHFFAKDTVFEAGQPLPIPLLWLDTASSVFDDVNGSEITDPEWVVSRIRLDAVSNWPANSSDPNFPKAVNAFRFVGHVPIVVNVHDYKSAADAWAKRYDTRLLFFAHAIRANGNDPLWFSTAANGVAPGKRSARFKGLTIGFSDADDITFENQTERKNADDPPTINNVRELHDLAPGRPVLSEAIKGVGENARFFAHVDGFRGGPPKNIADFNRKASFRAVSAPGGHRLILRCELNLVVRTRNDWAQLWNGIAQPLTNEAWKPEFALLTNSGGTAPTFTLAQEQVASSGVTRYDTPSSINWVATATFYQGVSGGSNMRVEDRVKVAIDAVRAPVALRRLRPQTGMTVMAGINQIDSVLDWQAVAQLTTDSPRRRILRNSFGSSDADWRKFARQSDVNVDLLYFAPVAAEDPWTTPGGTSPSCDIRVDLSSITTTDGVSLGKNVRAKLSASAIDSAAGQPELVARGGDNGSVRYKISAPNPWPSAKPALHVAGLEFDLKPDKFEQIVVLSSDPHEIDVRNATPVTVEMSLQATSARPVAPTSLPEQASAVQRDAASSAGRPLIFPLGNQNKPADFWLTAKESAGGSKEQDVSWNLDRGERSPEPDPTAKLIVVDSAPFRVAAAEALRPSTNDTSSRIATLKIAEDGVPAWRVFDREETVRLLLPPQAIGEAMEKNASTISDRGRDIDPGKAADMRFGSLTRIELDPTERSNSFHEPGWNLGRLFNRVDDAAPGPIVRGLRFELAYGLLVEHRPVQTTRLSEMAGILGQPPRVADLGSSAALSRARKMLMLESTRIAVDKLWQSEPSEDFETDEGLRFTLRYKTAKGGPATRFRFPAPSGYPAPNSALSDDRALLDGFADPTDKVADSDAFPGGIPWAFDSANILRECYSDPLSTSGRIGGLHFSALGGWGRQRAAFAGGKSVVETDTAMGRLSFYKLERLGRIGGLHNRAKHVVVYRRTVAPSAQFYNNDSSIGRKQDEHAGRPILRKVEEYVDILQPERRYPEDGSAVAEAGCVAGARFVSRRIYVDSDWGGDVRNEGWMVPLWSKKIEKVPASTDPDSPANLYPKPLVQLLMAGEDGEEVGVDIDTPERLVFYTSTLKSETGDLVDSWHAVESIDFCDAPPPIVKEIYKPRSSDLHEGMLAPAPRSAGGHDRLTLGLVDGKLPIKLGAGRVAESAAAVLKNVSISRARPLAGASPSAVGAEAARAAGADAAQLSADVRGAVDRLFGLVPARFEQLSRELLRDPGQLLNGRDHAKQLVRDCQNDLLQQLKALHEKFQQAAEKIDDQVADAGVDVKKLQQQLLGEVRQAGKSEARRILGRIDTAITQARDEVSQRGQEITKRWLLELDKLSIELNDLKAGDRVTELRERANTALEAAKSRAISLTDNAFANLNAEIAEVFRLIKVNLSALRRALPAAEDSILQTVDDAKAAITRLDQTHALKLEIQAWQLSNPNEIAAAKKQLGDFLSSVRVEALNAINAIDRATNAKGVPSAIAVKLQNVSAIIRDISTAVGVLQDKLDNGQWPPVDLPLFKQQLLDEVDKISNAVSRVFEQADEALAGMTDAVKDYFDPIKSRFDALPTLADLARWQADLETSIGTVATAVKADIDSVETAATDLLKPGGDIANDVIVAGAKAGAAIIATMRMRLETFSAQAEEALKRADQVVRQPLPAISTIDGEIESLTGEGSTFYTYLTSIGTAIAPISDRLREAIAGTSAMESDAAQAIERRISALADALIVVIDRVFDELGNTADAVSTLRSDIEDAISDQARQISGRVDRYLEGAQDELSRQLGIRPGDIVQTAVAAADQAKYLYQEGDNVLRLIRAVGDPPKGDGLGFNRPEVAYVFDLIKPVVDVTPVIALANRVADTVAAADQAAKAAGRLLESFGLRLPVEGIGRDLIPDSLKDLSISKLFPDLAGLDLEGLLKDAGFPDLSGKDSQGVKVTRGFDKDAREAWLRAEIDVELSKSTAIFDFGPVSLNLDKGRFRAETEMRLDVSGGMRKEAKGQIAGDWRVVAGGMDIITFEKTPLLFDKSGKIDFKIATERVRLAPSLEFLTNLMAKLGKSMPAGVEPLIRGGIPVGLISRLTLDLPPVATGAFAVTDLSLAASFGIIALPEFEITVGLDVASRDAPFTLAVWILNGGGYITQRLSYQPMARPVPLLTYTLDVSICAGVGIGFSFGVVSGAVWLQIGCSVALTWTTGRGGNVTTVTAYLLARGNVDVAGLVSASIMLRLEISYDGSVMIARGTLRLSFRISCFYTLRVAQGVEYKLAGERRSESTSTDYADSFG
ncbi:hypothetical protein GR211_33310 [Rhizobium leguminosarum]|uniref:apolipoprotein A1/A4/E family protein n=1 Tax=Rhizobium ruizarguesonis TaxID=2081791 RepID=UPI0013B9A53A|nr:apolipoprotein A1/A4/E family protein [Rhizobium ruizarguesonis]NEJ17728.1 hypothetical protein [Rhizobium ruizarguesonis]NEK31706.1 hypothetical protein [Rhizobium ruizarguesonis]